jgi:transcriptional regulator with XRE-family HTH domain
MEPRELKLARRKRAWNQKDAAHRLGLSQSYLSMLEKGERPVTASLARKMARLYSLPPTALPLTQFVPLATDSQRLAEQLAALGYPGFAYLRPRGVKKNPAEVLLTALAQTDLEARLVEALPWLLLRYWDIDANWLVGHAKRLDLQNRLGFLTNLAMKMVESSGGNNPARNQVLADLQGRLEQSRLAREDSFCQSNLSETERRWLRENRSQEAAHWNLLTDLRPEHLRYAP